MQSDFEKMAKKLENMKDMQNARPEDMLEIMSMFMKSEDMEQVKNMQNMLRLFGSMNNAKPEDMLNFLNLNKK